MNQLKSSIQYLLTISFSIFIYSSLQAHEFFPLSVGSEWVYKNKKTGQKLELKLTRPLNLDQRRNNPIQRQRQNILNQGQPPNKDTQRPRLNPPNLGQRPTIPKQIQAPIFPPNGLLIETHFNQEIINSRGVYIDSGSLNQVLLRINSGNFIFGLDQPFLPSKLTIGTKWSAKSQGVRKGCSLKTKWTVKAIEIVQVEAGKFRSLKITEENNLLNCRQLDLNQENTIEHIWYAAKVGPIKIMFMDGKTYELAKFKSALAVESSRHKLTTSWATLKKQQIR